jgi:hypothetical protein
MIPNISVCEIIATEKSAQNAKNNHKILTDGTAGIPLPGCQVNP